MIKIKKNIISLIHSIKDGVGTNILRGLEKAVNMFKKIKKKKKNFLIIIIFSAMIFLSNGNNNIIKDANIKII